MPELIAYPASPFRLGGRCYLAGEPMKGLTQEEYDFYLRRGTINRVPPKVGSNLTRLAAGAPVAPMTTEDAPNKPITPAEPPVQAPPPGEVQPQKAPGVPELQEGSSDAAAKLAERTRLAAERIGGGKRSK